MGKVFGNFECYKYSVPDGTSPLHDSKIRPKSSFAFVQQSVLDFRFQNGFFKKSLKPGRIMLDIVNDSGKRKGEKIWPEK
ncbi:MAG: hypothetical protein DRP97_01810 [Candidatus Latescibacterota bacterium]|nr:MAG: hypothetical protein B1H02_00915 [Candidatus Latescibacteria bacterium 4484_107]RKY71590.1 MAG: hypothetical protein DRP97_01810 [Candidatus Latescibacterota bacterium]